MRAYNFFHFVFLGLITFTFIGSLDADDSCPSLIAKIGSSEKSDWEFHHGSTTGILVGSAAILTGTEGLRAIHGSQSFNEAFLVNSGIDLVMTIIGHQIALIGLPERLQRMLNSKTEFLLRAGTNTLIDSIVMISFWQAAAVRAGVTIDTAERLGAILFCAITYGSLQLVRNTLFLNKPKKLDLKYSARLRAANSVFNVLKNQAHQKALDAKVDDVQEELLLLTFFENLIDSMPFESHIGDDSPIVAEKEEIKSAKQRKKFIQKLVTLYQTTKDEDIKLEIERVLYLGLPFTMEESFQFHAIFAERQKKKDRLKLVSTLADRTLGGVIYGGLVMRHMTQEALKN